MKPRIGITMRIVNAEGYDEPRDALSQDWITFLESCGGVPVLIPNALSEPVEFFKNAQCELLILSNGENVELAKDQDGNWTGTKRDVTEALLLDYCRSAQIPVMGYCRGLQFLNVYFGGSLVKQVEGHVAQLHSLDFVDAEFNMMFPQGSKVNSYHNMGVDENGLALTLKAWAKTGDVIEGVTHESDNICAVQWHPERDGLNFEQDKHLLLSRLFQDSTKERI